MIVRTVLEQTETLLGRPCIAQTRLSGELVKKCAWQEGRREKMRRPVASASLLDAKLPDCCLHWKWQ